ncbi:MAG: inositol monophosphatase family protein [Candidatus Sericytochromatia bacterium]
MNKEHLGNFLPIAQQAAQLGGSQLLAHRGKLAQIRSKSSSGDLVTEADLASEAAILTHFKTHLPEHAILAEESGKQETDSDWLWAIDPLDGTLNYAHNLPFFCVSIGLMFQLKPVLGVIYAPVLDELFWAYQGGGAWLNDQPIQVSQTDSLRQSFLATGFPYRKAELSDNNYAEFCYFADQTQDIRRPGSAALDLAYVACGRFDGFWERHLNAWDICAGAVLVEVAGGVVGNYDGEALDPLSGEIIASNGPIQHLLQQPLATLRERNISVKITL